MKKLLVIIGPTASGKTQLGIDIAKLIDGEIINADSRQIYKYLNIGTAKPPRDNPNKNQYVVDGILHHMIDFLDPRVQYSAYEFGIESQKIIKNMINQAKTPIIVGGTGLYVDFLTGKRSAMGQEADSSYRNLLNHMNLEELQRLAIKKNKKSYDLLNNSDKSNPRRLIRLIEKAKSDLPITQETEELEIFDVIYVMPNFLNMEALYERINLRVDIMFQQGFMDEVKSLLQMGYNKNDVGLKTMGYIDVINYLEDEQNPSYNELVALIKQKHRNYAKRQMTWFNNYNFEKFSDAEQFIQTNKNCFA